MIFTDFHQKCQIFKKKMRELVLKLGASNFGVLCMSFGSHARSLTRRSLARPLTANMLEKILLARSLLNVFEHFLRSLARSPRQLDYVKACSLASSYMYMCMLARSLVKKFFSSIFFNIHLFFLSLTFFFDSTP